MYRFMIFQWPSNAIKSTEHSEYRGTNDKDFIFYDIMSFLKIG